jgi:hypothetical protein
VCLQPLPPPRYHAGRRQRYCSNRCKQQAKWMRWRARNAQYVSNALRRAQEVTGE